MAEVYRVFLPQGTGEVEEREATESMHYVSNKYTL